MRFSKSFLIMGLFLALTCGNVFATVNIQLQSNQTNPSINTQFTVTTNLSGPDTMSSIMLRYNFDRAMVQAVSVSNIKGIFTIPDATAISNANTTTGQLTVGYTSISGTTVSGNEGVVSVTFQAQSTTGNTTIAGTGAEIYDNTPPLAGPINVTGTITDATVTIQLGPCTAAQRPTLTLLGTTPVTVNQGSAYTDPSPAVTATDCHGTDLIASVVRTGYPVNTTTLGNKTITYNVSDSYGNAATAVTRTVTVVAGPCTAIPVITRLGTSPVTVIQGMSYTDAGATAVDCHGTSVTVTTGGLPINTAVIGANTVTYNAVDSYGNNATQVTRTVNVIADNVPPVITLTGAASVTVALNGTYTEPGYTATDNKDGTITTSVVVTGGPVVTTAAATFTLRYNVSDAAGNAATERTRTVIVSPDTTPPVITLLGLPTVTVPINGTYVDAGATATDNISGNITSSIVVTGLTAINTANPGTYTVTYNVSDAAGNAATPVTRSVVVQNPNTAPAITLNAPLSMTICKGAAYTEPGYSATDAEDGNITAGVVVSGSVTVNTPGTYYLKYNVSDSGGLIATEMVRTVIVDTTTNCTANNPPVITITGSNPATVTVGSTYTDAGATATDDKDGTVAVTVKSNNVDTTKVGTYQVVYEAKDSTNLTTTATRTVKVVAPDTEKPVITVKGSNPATVQKGAVYTDAGATATDNVDGTVAVTASGTVNTATVGAYTITYTAKDAAGNTATATRTVNVTESTGCDNDKVPPVITIKGANPVTIMIGTVYTDAGASATDNVDGAVAVTTTSNTVDHTKAGSYPVTYSATDKCGNTATKTRTVVVSAGQTPLPPVITPPTSPDPETVQTTGYSHPAGTAHSSTQWQISTDPNFSNIIFTVDSRTALTSLPVPSLLLADNTTYYIRANYVDATGGQSGWATGESFKTGETNNDVDDDGVPDGEEVTNPAATFPNVDVTRAMFVNSARGNAIIGVEISTNVTSIASLEAVYPPDMPGSLSKVDIQLGLIGFKIKVTKGANVEVKVHLSKDMPDNAKWYVYNVINGWFEAPAAQYTIVDKHTLILKLTDGGFGDVDGIANGWVVDPSGYGYIPGDTDSVTGSEDNCFIESSAGKSASAAPSAIALALFTAVFAMMVFINRNKK